MRYDDDFEYYSRRAAEEVVRGDEATSEAVAAVHYEFAVRYGRLAAQAEKEEPEASAIEGKTRNSRLYDDRAPASPGGIFSSGRHVYPLANPLHADQNATSGASA